VNIASCAVNKSDLLKLADTIPQPLLERISFGIRWFLQLEN
jgi:hypothetical protein